MSPLLTIDTEASNLDIRNLNVTRDTASITATDLDIRNLDGTQDSIQIYNKSYVENFDSGTIVALGTRMLLPIIMVERSLLTVEKETGISGLLCFVFYNSPWKKIFRVTALAAFTAL